MTSSKTVKCWRNYCSTIVSLSSNSLESFRTEPVNESLSLESLFVTGMVVSWIHWSFAGSKHSTLSSLCFLSFSPPNTYSFPFRQTILPEKRGKFKFATSCHSFVDVLYISQVFNLPVEFLPPATKIFFLRGHAKSFASSF